MNISYLIYQAEWSRSVAEQREADVRAGELAAAVARFGRSRRHSEDARREGQHPTGVTVSCAIPRPR